MAETTINLNTIAGSVRAARLGIAIAVVLGAGAGVLWAAMSKPVYEAVIVAAPVEPDSQNAGLLGGTLALAGLVGITPAGQVTRKNEALATLQSRAFLNSFVTDLGLLPVLFPPEDGFSWRSLLGIRPEDPTLEDAYELLTENVLAVSDDRRTGLVEITVRWSDPEIAAQWGRALLARLNQEMQSRALRRSARELEFLEKELDKSSSVEIRQTVFRLMETQLKTAMLANVSEEFAMRVVDPPVAADEDRPASLSLAARISLGAFAGALVAMFLVIVRALPAALRG